MAEVTPVDLPLFARETERLKMNTLGCFVDGKQLLVEADIMLGDRAW
jgi:hypothetical protein